MEHLRAAGEEAHGGRTDEANLALACFDCNRFEGSDVASLDPETGAHCPLFNPRSDTWATHVTAQVGSVVPRTSVARIDAPARVELLGRWPAATG